jgi:hypothetical protein
LDFYADVPERIPQDSFILATSFPDILPEAGKILLHRAKGITVSL